MQRSKVDTVGDFSYFNILFIVCNLLCKFELLQENLHRYIYSKTSFADYAAREF